MKDIYKALLASGIILIICAQYELYTHTKYDYSNPPSIIITRTFTPSYAYMAVSGIGLMIWGAYRLSKE